MPTDPYLDLPEENLPASLVYTFTYCKDLEEEEEEQELVPAAVRDLNMLAVAAVSHTEKDGIKRRLAHRRLADRLVTELFPPNWNQIQPSFYYDREAAEGAREWLHVLYYRNAHFEQIARHSLHLQHFPMTDSQVDNMRRMTLVRLASLLLDIFSPPPGDILLLYQDRFPPTDHY